MEEAADRKVQDEALALGEGRKGVLLYPVLIPATVASLPQLSLCCNASLKSAHLKVS